MQVIVYTYYTSSADSIVLPLCNELIENWLAHDRINVFNVIQICSHKSLLTLFINIDMIAHSASAHLVYWMLIVE